MQNPNKNQDHLKILKKLEINPELTQRKLSKELGFSLGKLNYCLRELKKKGLIKIKNFKKNKNKLNYFYVLTPRGITQKTKLTINFMKRTMIEYDQLFEKTKKVNDDLGIGHKSKNFPDYDKDDIKPYKRMREIFEKKIIAKKKLIKMINLDKFLTFKL